MSEEMTSKMTDQTMTERDYRVLIALEKWGILGLGQLHGLVMDTGIDAAGRTRRFFNETLNEDYQRGLAKRLLVLVERGLIHQRFYMNRSKIFTLAEKGFESLKTWGAANLKGFRHTISDELVTHELMVAAVGLVVSEVLQLRVRTERERYVWTGKGGRRPAPIRVVSDLWIVGGAPQAIEVELTQKSEVRYKEIWDAYRLRLPENAAVLYLTSWPDGVRCILNHARQFRASFIYACGLQEFRESCGLAPFQGSWDGKSLTLADAIPDAVAAHRRVSPPSLPARPDFVGPGGRLGAEPFAAPSRSVRIGMLTPSSKAGRGQSVPPPERRDCPRPLPLLSPSPAPEGEVGGAAR